MSYLEICNLREHCTFCREKRILNIYLLLNRTWELRLLITQWFLFFIIFWPSAIKCQCCSHIETSQIICFYMRATLAFNGLNNNMSHEKTLNILKKQKSKPLDLQNKQSWKQVIILSSRKDIYRTNNYIKLYKYGRNPFI